MTAAGPKGPRDDFFCWKFRVWYNLRDCVFRHAWQTHPDCASCAQGASNLRLLGRIPDPPRWSEVARAGEGERDESGDREPRRVRQR